MHISSTYNKNTNKHNNFFNITKFNNFFALFLLIIAVFIFMNIFCVNYNKCAYAEDVESETIEEELEETTDKLIDDIDFSEIDAILTEIDTNFALFGGITFKDFLKKIVNGEETIDISDLFNILLSGVLESFKSILGPLLTILCIVLLCNMFNNVKSGKLSSVSEIIYFICFAVVVVIISTMTASLVSKAKSTLLSLQNQMNIVFPILLSLMTAMGGVVSVQAYTPMLAFLSGSISNIFVHVLLPLFSFSLILSIVGNLSENTRLTKLNGFINSTFKWIIGVVFAVFMGFLSLKGITAGSSDGISIKATKYAIKNYIPMLGGYISDGFELVKAGGMLVKNATGFASLLVLLATIITPIISVGILELGLKLLAGVVEPIGDKRTSNLLFDIGKSLKLLVVVLVGVSLMYFLTIFLITCSVSNFV